MKSRDWPFPNLTQTIAPAKRLPPTSDRFPAESLPLMHGGTLDEERLVFTIWRCINPCIYLRPANPPPFWAESNLRFRCYRNPCYDVSKFCPDDRCRNRSKSCDTPSQSGNENSEAGFPSANPARSVTCRSKFSRSVIFRFWNSTFVDISSRRSSVRRLG